MWWSYRWHQQVPARWQAPRRRGRLPSPTYLSELRRSSSDWRRLATSGRRLGRLDAGERLVGLLMLRDENDILDDHLRLATRFFDRIVALDGTPPGPRRERSTGILRSYPEVYDIIHDEELGLDRITDGARQHLLSIARERWGVDQWVGVLHADELHLRDPRPLLASLNPTLHPCVRVRLLHFFLHPDSPIVLAPDGVSDIDWIERVATFMWPGVPETRFFFDRGIRDYEVGRHSKVVPRSLRTGALFDGFLVPQLNFRDPAQAVERAHDRTTRGWQARHYRSLVDGHAPVGSELDLAADPLAGGVADPLLGASRPLSWRAAPVGPRRRDQVVPVFVGGTGRCGSTLVKSMLAEATGATAARFEWKALSWPAGLIDQATSPTIRRLVRLEARLRDHRPLSGPEEEGRVTTNWGFRLLDGAVAPPGYDAAVDLLLTVLRSRRALIEHRRAAVADFVATMWEASLPAASRLWIEHTPADVEVAGELLTLFPTAHVVFVRRNPLDIVSSLLARPWGPTTVESACDHILRVDRRWRESVAGLDPKIARRQCHVVRFEDAVNAADPVMTRLAATLQQGDGSRLAAARPPDRTPRTAADLSAAQLSDATRLLGELSTAWGYPPAK